MHARLRSFLEQKWAAVVINFPEDVIAITLAWSNSLLQPFFGFSLRGQKPALLITVIIKIPPLPFP